MIRVSQLSKSFRSSSGRVVAVDDVSFDVREGEVFGLLGPNGAGKTTTLRMIMGLLEPDAGEIVVGQADRTSEPADTPESHKSSELHPSPAVAADARQRRRLLGMISTNDGVYPYLTGRETLRYFGDLYNVPTSLADERIAALADVLKIGEYLDRRCKTLSTGQRQRIILARGLMHDPPVMLLDEPTRGLDVIGSRTVFEFIQLLRSQGKAILLSTHRLDEAERLCDRFALLHRGRIKATGTLGQLQAETGRQHLVDMFLDFLD